MATVVTTRPLHDRRGRRIRDPKTLARLIAHSDVPLLLSRARCRVCSGGCHFCRDGEARWVCGDCAEALPCCACFGSYRQRRAAP